MENKANERNNAIDIVATVMIIYTIVSHANLWSHTNLAGYVKPFLFCFMAFFFFKSGLFWKDPPPNLVLRKSSKFWIPFLFYAILGEIVRWIRLYVQEGDTDITHYLIYPFISFIGRGGPSGNTPLWFLVALFLTHLTVSVASKFKIPKYALLLFSITVSYLGILSNNHNLFIPPVFWEVGCGCVFFIIGYYMREIYKKRSVVIVAFLVYFILPFLFPSTYDFRKGQLLNGFWITFVLSSVAGSISLINLFMLSPLNKRVFGYVGRHSLTFFCLHWVLFDLTCLIMGFQINENGKPFGYCFSEYEDWKMFWSLIVVSAVVLPLYIYSLNIIKKLYKWEFLKKI